MLNLQSEILVKYSMWSIITVHLLFVVLPLRAVTTPY